METKTLGPWILQARLGYWDEKADGQLTVQDTRTGQTKQASLFRFPAGWRSGDIDRLEVPGYVKSAAHGLIRRLP